MKSWLVILGAMALSWHYLDSESTRAFEGGVLPLVFGLTLILALAKAVFMLGGKNAGGRGSGFDSTGGDGFFGNGDGNGGCGGD